MGKRERGKGSHTFVSEPEDRPRYGFYWSTLLRLEFCGCCPGLGSGGLRRADGDFKTDFGPGEDPDVNRGIPVGVFNSSVLRVVWAKGAGNEDMDGDVVLSSRHLRDVEEWEEGVEIASAESPLFERGCGDCVIRSTVSLREGRSWVSRRGMSVNWLLCCSADSLSLSVLDSERVRETVKRLLETLRMSLPIVLDCDDCDSDDSTAACVSWAGDRGGKDGTKESSFTGARDGVG